MKMLTCHHKNKSQLLSFEKEILTFHSLASIKKSSRVFYSNTIAEMDLFQEVAGSIVYKCLKSVRSVLPLAMYKNRNTGTGNGIRGTRGMVEMLYSGECRQTFRGMSSNIPGNVPKHSGECRQIFRGTAQNIPGIILQTFFML